MSISGLHISWEKRGMNWKNTVEEGEGDGGERRGSSYLSNILQDVDIRSEYQFGRELGKIEVSMNMRKI